MTHPGGVTLDSPEVTTSCQLIPTVALWLLLWEKGRVNGRLRREGRKEDTFVEPETQEGLCLWPKRWQRRHQSLWAGSHPERAGSACTAGLQRPHPWSYGGSPFLKQPPLSQRKPVSPVFSKKVLFWSLPNGLEGAIVPEVSEGPQELPSHLSCPET